MIRSSLDAHVTAGNASIKESLKNLVSPSCSSGHNPPYPSAAGGFLSPSETAFERDLRLIWNESFVDEKMKDDSYAILTRILGFCAVPRVIYSSDLNLKKNGEIQEVDYDSIDGFRLYISRGNEEDGMIVVNRVRSEMVDVVLATKKKIVVHVMDGVVMDSEFEQAVLPE